MLNLYKGPHGDHLGQFYFRYYMGHFLNKNPLTYSCLRVKALWEAPHIVVLGLLSTLTGDLGMENSWMGLFVTYYLARLWYTVVLFWTKEGTRLTLELLGLLTQC